MSKPTFKPVPEDHPSYDAHLLRATVQTGPWYLRSKIKQTDLTIDDFQHDVCERLASLMRKEKGYSMTSSSESIIRHAAFRLMKGTLHVHRNEMEGTELQEAIADDLKSVTDTKKITVTHTSHPLVKNRTPKKVRVEHTSDGPVVTIGATENDRRIAQKLEGIIRDSLQELLPFLCSLDRTNIVEFAVPLRMKLRRMLIGLAEKQFDTNVRTTMIDLIADEWNTMLNSYDREERHPSVKT